MKNSLQTLIREAFNTAYNLHKESKSSSLNEDAAELATRLKGPKEKAETDRVLDIIANQKPGWEKYKWDPTGARNKLNHNQFNYIIESLIEMAKSTKDPKFAKIFSSLYSVYPERVMDQDGNSTNVNSPVYNEILRNNSRIRGAAEKKPEIIFDLIQNAWGRLFFTKSWEEMLDKYKPLPGKNIGTYILGYLNNFSRDLSRSEKINKELGLASLDAPSNITGKSTDVGGDNSDFEDAGEGSSDIGTGFDDDVDNQQDRGETGLSAFSSDAGEIDKEALKQRAIWLKVQKFKKAITDVINASKTHSDIKNLRGLLVLEEIALNFLNYDEIAKKHPELYSPSKAINSILNSKPLVKSANDVLSRHGDLSYDIFKDYDWQTKYNLGPHVVDEIIEAFKLVSNASPSDKNKYAKIFKQFAIDHKTPEEIGESLGLSAANSVRADLDNLLKKSDMFPIIADDILHTYGFKNGIENVNWSDWVKAGKESIGLTKPEVAPVSGDEEQSALYPFQKESYEKFLAENMDKIMERVYKKLVKFL